MNGPYTESTTYPMHARSPVAGASMNVRCLVQKRYEAYRTTSYRLISILAVHCNVLKSSQVRIYSYLDLLLHVDAGKPFRVPIVCIFSPYLPHPDHASSVYLAESRAMTRLSPVVTTNRNYDRLACRDRNLVDDGSVNPKNGIREWNHVVLRSNAPHVIHDRMEAQCFLWVHARYTTPHLKF